MFSLILHPALNEIDRNNVTINLSILKEKAWKNIN